MQKKNKGFIALSSVLIISAVVLSIAATVSLLSIGEGQSSLVLLKGENNLQLVEGCTEDALLRSRNNPSYNGGAITRPEGTCTADIQKNGNVWTMTVIANDPQYQRSIQIIFTRNPTGITLTSWKEI